MKNNNIKLQVKIKFKILFTIRIDIELCLDKLFFLLRDILQNRSLNFEQLRRNLSHIAMNWIMLIVF